MLRSFSYAAHAGLERYLGAHAQAVEEGQRARLQAWEKLWQVSISNEFLSSYRKAIAARPELLPPPQQSQLLLDAYLLEKALYELLYELNNRPDWVMIPLTGILAL